MKNNTNTEAAKSVFITSENFRQYIAADGYVYYKTAFGTAGFPFSCMPEDGIGYWGEEHFKNDDGSVKLVIGKDDRKAEIITYSVGTPEELVLIGCRVFNARGNLVKFDGGIRLRHEWEAYFAENNLPFILK